MSCPYRCNIICGPRVSHCDDCGWNPKVEEERKQKLRSGKVKSFLKLNKKELDALIMKKKNGRIEYD